MSHPNNGDDMSNDILRRTARTVVVLVGACVVFVGGLSATAVVLASKAVAPAAHASPADADDAKPASPTTKKPLSI